MNTYKVEVERKKINTYTVKAKSIEEAKQIAAMLDMKNPPDSPDPVTQVSVRCLHFLPENPKIA